MDAKGKSETEGEAKRGARGNMRKEGKKKTKKERRERGEESGCDTSGGGEDARGGGARGAAEGEGRAMATWPLALRSFFFVPSLPPVPPAAPWAVRPAAR